MSIIPPAERYQEWADRVLTAMYAAGMDRERITAVLDGLPPEALPEILRDMELSLMVDEALGDVR